MKKKPLASITREIRDKHSPPKKDKKKNFPVRRKGNSRWKMCLAFFFENSSGNSKSLLIQQTCHENESTSQKFWPKTLKNVSIRAFFIPFQRRVPFRSIKSSLPSFIPALSRQRSLTAANWIISHPPFSFPQRSKGLSSKNGHLFLSPRLFSSVNGYRVGRLIQSFACVHNNNKDARLRKLQILLIYISMRCVWTRDSVHLLSKIHSWCKINNEC